MTLSKKLQFQQFCPGIVPVQGLLKLILEDIIDLNNRVRSKCAQTPQKDLLQGDHFYLKFQISSKANPCVQYVAHQQRRYRHYWIMKQ
eukprot:CAMPEP_0196586752 /NCGR_PEP_ID=MMETSP1081-20130531/55430_1 /TAXON_ID=36882 /ORGANISM="Pyramimonas amylifera, Strain CCMP720" /LENGTH=87 /DNA_ID=CAMNT_0041908731 /DNA_START=101 /DNA_END=364 /DNA_ORIENTATION=+